MSREDEVIGNIEADLKVLYAQQAKQSPGELDNKWKGLTAQVPKKYINDDLTIKRDMIRDFRKWTLFIPDLPIHNRSLHWIKSRISGAQLGSYQQLKEYYDVLTQMGIVDLLKQYPTNNVGNPNIFHYKGLSYTERWVRHIIFLSYFKRILAPKLGEKFTLLDIGSSYGIFSYLIKKEFPQSTHVLLDFPEQLVLAAYFLGMSFPSAKIAGFKELINAKRIDAAFLKQYDFVLLPWSLYQDIQPKSIDLVTNFASLGEMRREWFDYYMKHEPFLSAKYFFTANRFQSAPTYDTDLTILDYPLADFKKLHFQISPFFSHTYRRKYLFLYERLYFSSQYFEFIGER